MATREEVLGRIRASLTDVGTADEVVIPRGYHRTRDQPEGTLERFRERVADYKATVEWVPAGGVAEAVDAALRQYGANRVAVPPALPEEWLAAGHRSDSLVVDSPEAPLSVAELDAVDAVVTGSVVGIAETGTIVLESGGLCGRRALTLVPDVHVCIVRARDVVDDVPAAIERLAPSRPLTWISGPSATSDIELDRVEGVHGPRTLHVLLVPEDDRGPS